MEIQGSAADLIKLAMLAVHRRLAAEDFKARMLLQSTTNSSLNRRRGRSKPSPPSLAAK